MKLLIFVTAALLGTAVYGERVTFKFESCINQVIKFEMCSQSNPLPNFNVKFLHLRAATSNKQYSLTATISTTSTNNPKCRTIAASVTAAIPEGKYKVSPATENKEEMQVEDFGDIISLPNPNNWRVDDEFLFFDGPLEGNNLNVKFQKFGYPDAVSNVKFEKVENSLFVDTSSSSVGFYSALPYINGKPSQRGSHNGMLMKRWYHTFDASTKTLHLNFLDCWIENNAKVVTGFLLSRVYGLGENSVNIKLPAGGKMAPEVGTIPPEVSKNFKCAIYKAEIDMTNFLRSPTPEGHTITVRPNYGGKVSDMDELTHSISVKDNKVTI